MAMSSGGKINNVSIENASTYWSTYLSSLSAASQSKFYVATTVDALGTAQAVGGGNFVGQERLQREDDDGGDEQQLRTDESVLEN